MQEVQSAARGWAVRAEVVAPRVLAPGDVHDVEERARNAVKEPITLTVRSRTDVLVTGTEYEAAGDVRPTGRGDLVGAPESP